MEVKFVDRLKELIEREKIKQKDLAEDAGISEAALSRYMKGERIPHGETLCNLATALHTTTDYLLGRINYEKFDKEISFDEMQGILARNSKDYSSDQISELIKIILKNRY